MPVSATTCNVPPPEGPRSFPGQMQICGHWSRTGWAGGVWALQKNKVLMFQKSIFCTYWSNVHYNIYFINCIVYGNSLQHLNTCANNGLMRASSLEKNTKSLCAESSRAFLWGAGISPIYRPSKIATWTWNDMGLFPQCLPHPSC